MWQDLIRPLLQRGLHHVLPLIAPERIAARYRELGGGKHVRIDPKTGEPLLVVSGGSALLLPILQNKQRERSPHDWNRPATGSVIPEYAKEDVQIVLRIYEEILEAVEEKNPYRTAGALEALAIGEE